DELAFFEAAARQPFDLHEELRAEIAQQIDRDGLVLLRNQRAKHPIAPCLRLRIVLPKVGLDRVVETASESLEPLPQTGRPQMGKVGSLEVRRAESRRAEREEVHLRPSSVISLRAVDRDLLQLPRQAQVVEFSQACKLLAGQVPRARKPIVVVDRALPDADPG